MQTCSLTLTIVTEGGEQHAVGIRLLMPVRRIPYQSCRNINGCILHEALVDGSFCMISIDDHGILQDQEGEAVGSSSAINLRARTEVECITSPKHIFLTERRPNHIFLMERRPRGGDGDDIIKMMNLMARLATKVRTLSTGYTSVLGCSIRSVRPMTLHRSCRWSHGHSDLPPRIH